MGKVKVGPHIQDAHKCPKSKSKRKHPRQGQVQWARYEKAKQFDGKKNPISTWISADEESRQNSIYSHPNTSSTTSRKNNHLSKTYSHERELKKMDASQGWISKDRSPGEWLYDLSDDGFDTMFEEIMAYEPAFPDSSFAFSNTASMTMLVNELLKQYEHSYDIRSIPASEIEEWATVSPQTGLSQLVSSQSSSSAFYLPEPDRSPNFSLKSTELLDQSMSQLSSLPQTNSSCSTSLPVFHQWVSQTSSTSDILIYLASKTPRHRRAHYMNTFREHMLEHRSKAADAPPRHSIQNIYDPTASARPSRVVNSFDARLENPSPSCQTPVSETANAATAMQSSCLSSLASTNQSVSSPSKPTLSHDIESANGQVAKLENHSFASSIQKASLFQVEPTKLSMPRTPGFSLASPPHVSRSFKVIPGSHSMKSETISVASVCQTSPLPKTESTDHTETKPTNHALEGPTQTMCPSKIESRNHSNVDYSKHLYASRSKTLHPSQTQSTKHCMNVSTNHSYVSPSKNSPLSVDKQLYTSVSDSYVSPMKSSKCESANLPFAKSFESPCFLKTELAKRHKRIRCNGSLSPRAEKAKRLLFTVCEILSTTREYQSLFSPLTSLSPGKPERASRVTLNHYPPTSQSKAEKRFLITQSETACIPYNDSAESSTHAGPRTHSSHLEALEVSSATASHVNRASYCESAAPQARTKSQPDSSPSFEAQTCSSPVQSQSRSLQQPGRQQYSSRMLSFSSSPVTHEMLGVSASIRHASKQNTNLPQKSDFNIRKSQSVKSIHMPRPIEMTPFTEKAIVQRSTSLENEGDTACGKTSGLPSDLLQYMSTAPELTILEKANCLEAAAGLVMRFGACLKKLKTTGKTQTSIVNTSGINMQTNIHSDTRVMTHLGRPMTHSRRLNQLERHISSTTSMSERRRKKSSHITVKTVKRSQGSLKKTSPT